MPSDDLQSLREDQQEVSDDYVLDPQDLVYEAPTGVEEDEAPIEVEIKSEESALKDDEPIIYASENGKDPSESLHSQHEDQKVPQEGSSRVCTAERNPGSSAESYRNVDGLVSEMSPTYYQNAGGLNDCDDSKNSPPITQISGYDVADDKLVVVDVDFLQEGEELIIKNASIPAKASSLDVSSSPTHSSLSKRSDDMHAHAHIDEDPAEDDSAYAGMHPSIAQAIKTRNSHFPLLNDSKLPHTRENFNLPPLVEGHTISVTRGTYSDYTFDLERQEYLQREEVTKAHTEYLEAHHELKQIVSDFLTSVLTDKPTDVYQYAADYFSAAID